MWGGSGSWGGTGMWGTGSGMGWLTNNPDALQAWLAAARRPPRRHADLVRHLQGRPHVARRRSRPCTTSGPTFWNDMKAFYEQYGNGATWTCPAAGMWGGWHGRHDGRLLGSRATCGAAATAPRG